MTGEPGIVGGMVEYVALAVLSIHRDWRTCLDQQRTGYWQPRYRQHDATPADAVIGNIRRHRDGLPMFGLVDRARGYWHRKAHNENTATQ